MLSFAAQDTSFERPIVAKAESCRTIPFVVSLVKGMFAIHSRPLRWKNHDHVYNDSSSVSSHDATVPNHRVERIQCQTIATEETDAIDHVV